MASYASSSAMELSPLSGASTYLNLWKTFGASTPPLRHKMFYRLSGNIESDSDFWKYPRPSSAIFSFKLIFWLFSKKEMEYLVSPNKFAIYSAIYMALSFVLIVSSTVPFFS